MMNTKQATPSMNHHQTGPRMIDVVPDWVPEDLRMDWAEKHAICEEAGLEPAQAARQADQVVLRALSFRQARHE